MTNPLTNNADLFFNDMDFSLADRFDKILAKRIRDKHFKMKVSRVNFVAESFKKFFPLLYPSKPLVESYLFYAEITSGKFHLLKKP